MHIFSFFGNSLILFPSGPNKQRVGFLKTKSVSSHKILFIILTSVSLFSNRNSFSKSSPVIPIAFLRCFTNLEIIKGTSSPLTFIISPDKSYSFVKALHLIKPEFFGMMNKISFHFKHYPPEFCKNYRKRKGRIELSSSGPQPDVLPLNYIRHI